MARSAHVRSWRIPAESADGGDDRGVSESGRIGSVRECPRPVHFAHAPRKRGRPILLWALPGLLRSKRSDTGPTVGLPTADTPRPSAKGEVRPNRDSQSDYGAAASNGERAFAVLRRDALSFCAARGLSMKVLLIHSAPRVLQARAAHLRALPRRRASCGREDPHRRPLVQSRARLMYNRCCRRSLRPAGCRSRSMNARWAAGRRRTDSRSCPSARQNPTGRRRRRPWS